MKSILTVLALAIYLILPGHNAEANPSPSLNAFFRPGPLVGQASDETFIDRETLAYYLRDLLHSARGEQLKYFLDHCEGVLLQKRKWGTEVTVKFTNDITYQFNTPKGAKKWELYGFYMPKTWRFAVAITDGAVRVFDLDSGDKSLELWVRIPWGPDEVLIRSLDGDLATGQVDIHLGAFWNTVSIEAGARILDRKFDGVDVWESVKANVWDLLSPIAGISVPLLRH